MKLPNSVIEAMLCLANVLDAGLTKGQCRVVAGFIRNEFGMDTNGAVIKDDKKRFAKKTSYTDLWHASDCMNKSNFSDIMVYLTNRKVFYKDFDKNYEFNIGKYLPSETERRVAIETIKNKRSDAFRRENKAVFKSLKEKGWRDELKDRIQEERQEPEQE